MELIGWAWAIWGLCGVAAVICLVYDFNHARQIRKWLREDYGQECCQRLREDWIKSGKAAGSSGRGAGSRKEEAT